MFNLRNILVLVGIVGALGTGCIIDVASRSAYDSCGAGDTCGGGTSCSPSVLVPVGGSQGSLCTVTCVPGVSTCTNGGVSNGVCALTPSGRAQCFRSCASSFDCGSGSVCVAAGGLQVCVPNAGGTPVTCGGSGQSCCAGNACSSGLACGTGNVCGVPCGGSGQACCPGNSCTGSLACASGVCSPGATAYGSCAPAGSACTDGTSCIQALARGQTTPVGNTCTSICSSGAASMCPGYVPGRVECVNLTGNPSMFQCVRLCTSAADCTPYRTQCLLVQSAGGAMIQICAP